MTILAVPMLVLGLNHGPTKGLQFPEVACRALVCTASYWSSIYRRCLVLMEVPSYVGLLFLELVELSNGCSALLILHASPLVKVSFPLWVKFLFIMLIHSQPSY